VDVAVVDAAVDAMLLALDVVPCIIHCPKINLEVHVGMMEQ